MHTPSQLAAPGETEGICPSVAPGRSGREAGRRAGKKGARKVIVASPNWLVLPLGNLLFFGGSVRIQFAKRGLPGCGRLSEQLEFPLLRVNALRFG